VSGGFSSLNTALTGLSAAQRALDTTSQNIVNANTPGYSRQRVLVESVGASPTASFHSGTSAVIGGVHVSDVSRIRDAFLEATRAAAGGKQSSIGSELDILNGTQQLLAEPGDNGLQGTLDSFYSSWQDLSNNPSDTAASGAVVIQRGIGVADQLHSVSDGLASQWTTAHDTLNDVVAQTNQATTDLAKLNGSIETGQAAGQPVNELLDTRDTLVRKLATLVGATASMDAQGRVSLSVNGINIVAGDEAQTMQLTGGNDISTATTSPPGLAVAGYTVPVASGSAAGLLAAMRTDLPTVSAQVDTIASSIIGVVNSVYATGYAADGTTGNTFFSGTDAHSIAVVPTQGTQLATAAAANTVDGSVAAKIGDLTNDVTSAAVLGSTGPSAQWRQLTGALGVQVQSLTTGKSVQDSVVSTADDAVQSDAGVNLDEEMTNMMLFQRSYQASARVITTTDEIMDTLINHTGVL
jgi:flagellar hook-associated protein 1